MQTNKPKQSSFLLFVFIIQVLSVFSLLLDIPIVRQISGFLFLIFIPGFAILRLLRLKFNNLHETILFSIGLSIAYLLILGFLQNEIGHILNISYPLSTEFLSISIHISVSLMYLLSYIFSKEEPSVLSLEKLKKIPKSLLYLIIPMMCIFGILNIFIFNNNLFLLLTIILIPIIFVSSLFLSKSSYYPIIVFSIALGLLFSTSLVSKYVYGPDIALEYNVFRETQKISSLNWEPIFYGQLSYKSMLSVTLLPTIFSNLLNLGGDLVFKIIFSIIFALVPVGLYQLFQIQWSKKVAFISAIFFVSNFMFYGLMISLAKQMIAELFYVLIFLLVLSDKWNFSSRKWIMVMLFTFGLIVSHYGTSYIFLFLIITTVLFVKLFLKNKNVKIKSPIIGFAFSFTFLWYTNVVVGPIDNLVQVIQKTLDNFIQEFLYFGSRGEQVEIALGLVESSTILHEFGRIIHNISSLLILIGFIWLLFNWKKRKIDSEFGVLTIISMGLLVSALIIPRIAGALELSRWYHLSLIFLSPLFVIGAKTIFTPLQRLRKKMKKNRNIERFSLVFVSTILVTFYLFQTGFIYEITNDPEPSSIALSINKLQDSNYLIFESDVYSAFWLSKYGDINNIITFADTVSVVHVLTSYSDIDRSIIRLLENSTRQNRYPELYYTVKEIKNPNISYVYLRQFNVKNEQIIYNTKIDTRFNLSELPVLNSTIGIISKIYSNGYSEIYSRYP